MKHSIRVPRQAGTAPRIHTNPLIVELKNRAIGGHGRRNAIRKRFLMLQPECAYVRLRVHCNQAQIAAIRATYTHTYRWKCNPVAFMRLEALMCTSIQFTSSCLRMLKPIFEYMLTEGTILVRLSQILTDLDMKSYSRILPVPHPGFGSKISNIL